MTKSATSTHHHLRPYPLSPSPSVRLRRRSSAPTAFTAGSTLTHPLPYPPKSLSYRLLLGPLRSIVVGCHKVGLLVRSTIGPVGGNRFVDDTQHTYATRLLVSRRARVRLAVRTGVGPGQPPAKAYDARSARTHPHIIEADDPRGRGRNGPLSPDGWRVWSRCNVM